MAVKAKAALTTADLEATLDDGRHLGFGYACSRDLAARTRARLDRAVVAVANELGLDAEQLFQWANSKGGRWLTDAVAGRDEAATRATVRKYLSADFVREILAEP
jgi:hypothetical protein